MEGVRTKEAEIETCVNHETQGSYETVKSGDWNSWHGNHHDETKGDINKGRIYTITYSPGAYRNTTVKR